MTKTGPHRIQRGPMAGLTVTAEAYRLPSGDWAVDLIGEPWDGRSLPARHTYCFRNCMEAYAQVKLFAEAGAEMAEGPYTPPVLAY